MPTPDLIDGQDNFCVINFPFRISKEQFWMRVGFTLFPKESIPYWKGIDHFQSRMDYGSWLPGVNSIKAILNLKRPNGSKFLGF